MIDLPVFTIVILTVTSLDSAFSVPISGFAIFDIRSPFLHSPYFPHLRTVVDRL